jgi:choline transport protein
MSVYKDTFDKADTPQMSKVDAEQSSDALEYSHKGDLLNASGHVQELRRNFSLWSIAGLGLSVGVVWPAAGGSILVAIFNGGPPGTLPMCSGMSAANRG